MVTLNTKSNWQLCTGTNMPINTLTTTGTALPSNMFNPNTEITFTIADPKAKKALRDVVFKKGDYEPSEDVLVRNLRIKIKKIIFNAEATTVIFYDGEKVTVKCSEGDEYSEFAAINAAIIKKLLGSCKYVRKIVKKRPNETIDHKGNKIWTLKD